MREVGVLRSFGRDLPPAHPRRPRLRELPDRRREGRRGRRGRPAAGHRRVPAAGPLPGRPHRARARDAQPRRPRLRPRAAGRRPPARASTSTATRRPTTTTSRSTTAGSSSSARCACARCTRPATGPSTRAFALIDTERGEEPWAVLSGDSLFVGDIARPGPRRRQGGGRARDLPLAARQAARAARHRRAVARPPRRLAVRRARDEPQGRPRRSASSARTRRCWRSTTRTRSWRETTAGLGPQPPNFRNIVALNRGPLVMETPEAHPLTPRQVEQAGALVVDVRTELQFDEAHIPGAVSITARRAGFGSKLAWLAEPGQPIVLVGRDDDDALDAAGLAAAVGLRDDRRLPRRRHDLLARGAPPRRARAADDRARAARAPGRTASARRCSTCASAPSGTPATSPARCSCPTTTSAASPRASTPRGRWPSCAAPGSARRSPRACSSATARDDVIHVVDGGVPLWERSGWPVERA